jgi:hypothetical protein
MSTLIVLLGFILLFAGSQLYWLFVAAASLIAGGAIQTQSAQWASRAVSPNDALSYGLLGTVFAITSKPLAVLVAGFVCGGYLTYSIPELLGMNMEWYAWPFFIFGGGLTVAMLIFLYSYGLVIITAFTGATLIAQNFTLANLDKGLMLGLLLGVGVVSQLVLFSYIEPTLD